jgi:hypothetical protein
VLIGIPDYHKQLRSINVCTIFCMNKYSFLIVLLSLFLSAHVLAQTKPDKKDTEKHKHETAKSDDKAVIKVVPTAKNKHAKPEKVSSAKPRTAKPGGTRPARNVRPSSRPVRPGNGRN